MNEHRVYLRGEVAKMFRVNPATVNVWINQGHLEVLRTAGGQARITAAGLEKFAPGITEPDAEELVTSDEIAAIFGLSRKTVARYATERRIRSFKMPGGGKFSDWRFRVSEVMEDLQKRPPGRKQN